MKRTPFLLLLQLCLIGAIITAFQVGSKEERLRIAAEMDNSIQKEMLNKWYPQNTDKQFGGFLSSFTFDWKPSGNQDKMVVTQARHTWSNARAAEIYPAVPYYKTGSQHGFRFLRDVMWDKVNGGFYTFTDRSGKPKPGGFSPKEAYGNAFGIYATATYYQATGDTSALNFARQAFMWLENHSHDPINKGYFQHPSIEGKPIIRPSATPSTSDLGYKDQNSSIHLLEAFSELYSVWPEKLVKERLQEMLVLIRDKMVHPKGYLQLFFYPDWKPVTFADSSETAVLKHKNLDHVSFGHDIETAYLMLEASHLLGLHDDTATMRVAKLMTDHSLNTGWDNETGGFYDEGYYFKNKPGMTIIKDSKNWWAQAEGLNTLLLMADQFPDDPQQYYKKFLLQWQYINKYLIDHEHGDWYAGGLDKEPKQKTALKGHIWKGNYHQLRSLVNRVLRLRPDTLAPATPAALAGKPSTAQGIMLQWNASKDNDKILGYNIYENDIRSAFTPLTRFYIPTQRRSKTIYVTAVDLHGNESARSDVLTY